MDKVVLKREIEAISNSTDSKEIIRNLKERFKDSVETEEIEQIMAELKLEKRTFLGWALMAVGSVIGFISMLLTVLRSNSRMARLSDVWAYLHCYHRCLCRLLSGFRKELNVL
ncbi:MAG: hypothetical protein IPO27_13065 [Bacteroidetes bacterium]|nr:hypothetical protein [Bacteroidota bacterium]